MKLNSNTQIFISKNVIENIVGKMMAILSRLDVLRFHRNVTKMNHYCDVINTDVLIVCSIVCPGTGQRKHQRFASLAFVRGIHLWPSQRPKRGKWFYSMTSSWWLFCMIFIVSIDRKTTSTQCIIRESIRESDHRQVLKHMTCHY